MIRNLFFKKTTVLVTFFAIIVIGTLVLPYYFLTTLRPDELLVGATSHNSYKLPPFVFQMYIKSHKAIPPNYHTDNGLPAIQFVANGRSGDLENNANSIEMIEYLLRNGADVNETSNNKHGLTAMHIAVMNNDIQLAESLLRNGGDPNALASGEKYKGMTPLRLAMELEKNSNTPQSVAVQELIRKNGGHE